MKKTIFFDLEGPLSPQDNAYEVMKRIGKEGAQIFELISRYDDLIALEGREGYEPGDTLALIVPFLLLHGITEEEITKVSERAKIVEGAEYLFDTLRAEHWDTYIISTSYKQHAYRVGRKLGIPERNIICTALELESRDLDERVFSLIKNAEEEIIELYSRIDEQELIVNRLDEFFFRQLPAYGYAVFETRVIGGERKAEAVRAIAKEKGVPLSEVIAVGDSITDYKMLNEVAAHGGIAVVFNGNEYAVPYANVGLASVDLRFLYLVCEAFAHGGKGEVMEMVTKWEERREKSPAEIAAIPEDLKGLIMEQKVPIPYFHNIERADERRREEILRIHKRVRMHVREDAGKLG